MNRATALPRRRELPSPLSVVLLALLLGGTAQAQEAARLGWPFGVPPSGGPSLFGKKDLYNLGLIGAKARDADVEEVVEEMTSGRRTVESTGEKEPDVGPKRLQLRGILPGGPAHKAKLRLDDFIVGINGTKFDAGCFEPLATALREAESTSAKRTITLMVQRQGKKGLEDLEVKVKIPSGGAEMATPMVGKGAETIVEDACRWLADAQSGDGGFPETLGGMTGAVVQTCMAGLAWIAGGSNLARGKHRANLAKAYDFVLRGLTAKSPFDREPGGPNWDQSTWAYAHAAVFVGELCAAKRSPKLKASLQDIVNVLQERVESTGGYGHGPGGKNALGYIELNIMACYVLPGLALAKQAGCKVDDAVVKKITAYIESSGNLEDGGVGYATGEGQTGHGNIGRTAGCWLGFVGLGLAQNDWTKKMESYVRANIGACLDGHASLMQHYLLSGVAAGALGGDVHERWVEALERDFTLARAPDGSFQPRPWHETVAMKSNTDVSVGDVWTTACWAVAIGAGADQGKKGGLPGWCGRNVSE